MPSNARETNAARRSSESSAVPEFVNTCDTTSRGRGASWRIPGPSLLSNRTSRKGHALSVAPDTLAAHLPSSASKTRNSFLKEKGTCYLVSQALSHRNHTDRPSTKRARRAWRVLRVSRESEGGARTPIVVSVLAGSCPATSCSGSVTVCVRSVNLKR